MSNLISLIKYVVCFVIVVVLCNVLADMFFGGTVAGFLVSLIAISKLWEMWA